MSGKETLITFSEGKLELPKEVQEEEHLIDGMRLRLVSATPSELRLESAGEPPQAGARWLGNRWWIPNEASRSLEGLLSGHPEHDTTRVRAEERAWELEHDERKLGAVSKP